MPAQLNASIELVVTVLRLNTRMKMILGDRMKRTGGVANLGQPRVKSLMLVREMLHRFSRDHYWATVDEWGRLKELFDWLHEQHRLNQHRQPETKPFEWNDDAMFTSRPLEPGTFRGLYEAHASGDLEEAEAVRIVGTKDQDKGLILP